MGEDGRAISRSGENWPSQSLPTALRGVLIAQPVWKRSLACHRLHSSQQNDPTKEESSTDHDTASGAP